MAGKAYTMKEMKAIVDYLTENKAYNEVKGRKMWMDFEKSKLTDRTWQSLKETFLKRILPDIHNPYYQLSVTQISSFRQGYDVESKLKNKLEIMTVSEESSTNVEQALNTEHPSTSNNNASGRKSGEETINTKTVSDHRSSAETVVLDPCYDTAEDIQNELESKNNDKENNSDPSSQKSLRDLITYSEPLTPMLQEVIEDFATDEESDSVTKMEIVEDVSTEKKTKDANSRTSDGPFEISSGDDACNDKEPQDQPEPNNENQHNNNEVANENREQLKNTGLLTQQVTETSVQEIPSTEVPGNDKSSTELTSAQEDIINNDKNVKEIATLINTDDNIETNSLQNQAEKTNNSVEIVITQNTTTNTTDTLIPNNQEALNTQSDILNQIKDKEIESKITDESNELNKRKRKRYVVKVTELGSRPWSASDNNDDAEIQEANSELLESQVCNPKQRKIKVSDTENKEDCIKDRNTKQLEKVIEPNAERVSLAITTETGNITEAQADPTRNSSEVENPCLKSVSLYDEQFTSTKYSESSDDGIADPKRNQQEEKNTDINQKSSDNDIVLVKSHSESGSQHINKRKTPGVCSVPTKSERQKVLANMFGFSGGTMTSSRKRRLSYRNRSAPRHSRARCSESSEWTSESDTEVVSPPRGRTGRHSGRYLKPKSARIFSLGEEGGLFVMYGKKIYPVVKDDKRKNYVCYARERDSSGDDESYWKHKYMEEKKRTATLAKLLHQSEDNGQPSSEKGPEDYLTQRSSPKKPNVCKSLTETKPESSATSENVPNKISPEVQNELVTPKEPVQNKTVKIKITKQNEEVELEGHWSQITSVLNHVVQIFHKEHEAKPDLKSLAPSEQTKTSLSGLSTPIIPIIDQDVHEKVTKLETVIFQEIESRDKQIEHSVTPVSLSSDSSKITKRRQPKRSKGPSVIDTPTPEADKNGLSSPSKNVEKEENAEKSAPAEVETGKTPTAVVRRITRTSKNALRESIDTSEIKTRNTRTKKAKEPPAKEIMDEEADVRYKLRSPPQSAKKATRSAANKTTKEQKPKNRYVKITEEVVSSRDNIILNTIESSQGYQDSDVSPPKLLRKRKIRRNIATLLSDKAKPLSRQNIRRRSQLKYYEMSDQSSNSCPNFALISKTIRKEGSSSNSDIYRSESLQLLMPKTTVGVKSNSEVYDAFSQEVNRIITNAGHNNFEAPIIDKDLLTVENISNGNNSSNVSLPPSPILSIVENLSVDKNSLNVSYDENIIAHEYQIEEFNNNDLVKTNEDVTMLLMGRGGDNQATILRHAEQIHNENSSNAMVTDSFLNKLYTVNLNQDNPTVSDSLHQKIRNLLLESTKKISPNSREFLKDEESNEMDVETEELYKKNRLNKRCSTPLKRQVTKKVKRKKNGMKTFVEEEHTDSCSQSARRSCPPLTYNPCYIEHLSTETANPPEKPRNSKSRKKKDNVIKVKILKPKAKSHSREILTEQTKNNRETKSIHGDSGINDTESNVLRQELDISVELIHNHSETCLQTDECINNSIEYVESNKSVITLINDSELSNNSEHKSQSVNDSAQNIHFNEFLIGDSGTASVSRNVTETSPADANVRGTYQTTPSRESPDSLITEDLSEPEPEQTSNKPSKWYLLSEDENTNFPQPLDYGSDLNKLFPIACAVPNLSTITEMSKDNDNKPIDTDGDTRNDLLSQSLFDSNF